MSRAPKPIDPAASPRHRFGFTLRQLRGQAGHSLQGFARRLGKSDSYPSAVELAQAPCTEAFAADCERLLGAEGRLLPLWAQADRDWTQRTGHRSQAATVPEWVGTAAELLYEWAAGVPWTNGRAGTAGQAGTTHPTGVAGTHGAFLGGMLAGMGLPAVPPFPPPTPPATGRTLPDQLRAARLAVDVADALAAALRAGDAEQTARGLAAFEQASRTYHATAGEDPGGDADGEAASS